MQNVLSKKAKLALEVLGQMIKMRRLARDMSQQELAMRLRVTRLTVAAIEKGMPTVGIGIVFEAAVIVGVSLMEEDSVELNVRAKNLATMGALLPKRGGRKRKELDDEF